MGIFFLIQHVKIPMEGHLIITHKVKYIINTYFLKVEDYEGGVILYYRMSYYSDV
jgi:hypothetical protein